MEVEESKNSVKIFRNPRCKDEINRSLPREKLQYRDKSLQPLDQSKSNNVSKLPRVYRTPIYKTANNTIKTNSKDDAAIKIKPSSIPRRINAKNKVTERQETVKETAEHQIFSEGRNIQRVQLLINSDFYQDARQETTSVVSARPIPTLGQIYGNNNIIDSERVNDWFTRMSLQTPVDSLESNPQNLPLQTSNDSYDTTRGLTDVEIACSCMHKSAVIIHESNLPEITFKPTNQNVSDWITTKMKNSKENESGDICNKNQSSSNENAEVIEDKIRSKEVSSYVYCPSEELQRTTNLEGDGCESQKAFSSIVGRDLEISDDVSSQYTMEPIDSCRIFEDHLNREWNIVRDPPNCRNLVGSKGTTDEITLSQFWYRHYRERESDYYKRHSSCWRKNICRHNYESKYSDSMDRHKKCERYKTFPHKRNRLSTRLNSFKKRFTIKICSRRWNHVWKKTAERWALWSKSPSNSKKIRMMHYLQRSIIWEDVDVQTTLYVCRETGTDSVLKEQKSATINALFKLTSNSQVDTSNFSTFVERSDTPNTPESKIMKSRVNQGPSRFPFVYSSQKRSLQLKKSKITAKRISTYFSSHEECKNNISHINKSEVVEKINDHRDINSLYLDKDSDKELQTYHKVVNNSLDLEHERPINTVLNDTYTQMTKCNNAATETTFVSTFQTWDSNSIGTMTSKRRITLYRPSGINTETQITPLIKISRGISTVIPKCEKKTSVINMGLNTLLSSLNVQKTYSAVQTQPKEQTFTCTSPKLLSISSTVMKSTSAVTSCQNVANSVIITDNVTYKDNECLTTPSLQQCNCRQLKIISNEVETINAPRKECVSAAEMDTYYDVNTNNSLCNMNTNLEAGVQSIEKYDARPLRSTCIEGSSSLSMCTLNGSFKDVATHTPHISKDGATDLEKSTWFNCEVALTSKCTSIQNTQVSNIDTTNTATKEIDLECSTQTPSVVHQRRAEIRTPVCTTVCSKQDTSKNYQLINERIMSLSRLIGHRRSSSEVPPNFDASGVFSGRLDADKWIKRGYDPVNEYYRKVKMEGIKPVSSSGSSDTAESSKHRGTNSNVVSTLPIMSLSKDSLLDVLPIQKLSRRTSDSKVEIRNRDTIDRDTSGYTITKDVKECKLQASPEVCNTATEYTTPKIQKSASILTSRCYLPFQTSCFANESNSCVENRLSDCYYIYAKPRCLVHNKTFNTAIQIEPNQIDREQKEKQNKNRSVGLITTYSTSPVYCYTKPSDVLEEILSPKVYKALYETIKLVFKEDSSKLPLIKHSLLISRTGVADGKLNEAQKRSAEVIRSRVTKQQTYLDNSTQTDNDYNWSYKAPVIDSLTQTCSNCRSALTNLSLDNPKCIEGIEEYFVKSQLISTYRYYSKFFVKQFGRVRENFTKHILPSSDPYYNDISKIALIEASTMKPSGYNEHCCQTNKIYDYHKTKPISCVLTQATSLTDLCQHDREHLKSIYYMLSAIEGRIRRLEANLPT